MPLALHQVKGVGTANGLGAGRANETKLPGAEVKRARKPQLSNPAARLEQERLPFGFQPAERQTEPI